MAEEVRGEDIRYPDVVVDRESPVPLYFQVASRLQQQIESGEMPVGSRLENEIELADRLGVSRPTMRRAISYLVERGMLVRKRGVGTQIVHPKVRRPVELTSLHDDLLKNGQEPRTVVREARVVAAPDDVAQALGIPFGADVTWIERLRYAGDEPLALMHNAVPLSVLEIDPEVLERRGLYDLLRVGGHAPRMAKQVVGARTATSAEARLLGEQRGSAVLTMTRTAWDEAGRAVEYGSHVYRASLYSFELNLTT
ncbi:MAG: GntR family transcriptional regulator [Pseudonocardiaceae bacterium]|nr:MAG: GntR family transcriptional regulator [Pseudonocardiaceae bacterium]